MYIVSKKTIPIHRNLLRFRRRLLVDRQERGFEGFDWSSGLHGVANSTARALIAGRAEQAYPAAIKCASLVMGREVLGCGEESLVVRRDSPTPLGHSVIKYATRPAGDPLEIRDELARRYDIATGYIGKWIVPTEFEIGHIQQGDDSVPRIIVMTQPFVSIQTEDYEGHPDLGEFCERAVAMGYNEGLTFDLTLGAGNLIVDTNGDLAHVDTPYTSREQDGKLGLLSPNMLDSRVNIAKLEQVLASCG